MEIEAKYRLPVGTSPADLEAVELGPYRLGAAEEHDLEDTLLDTAERAVTGAGYALRLRRDGLRRIVTLKGPGNVSGAVHRRDEFEADVARDDRKSWPGEIRSRVQALIGGAPLEPIAQVRNHRRTWQILSDDGEIGELALDHGSIQAGGRETSFDELEIELRGGGSDVDLATLEQRLNAALKLEPEPKSKLARALDLIQANGEQTEAAPAEPVAPSRRPVEEVGKEIVREQLEKMAEAEPIAREDSDVEGVHDMRVATRRLRAALQALENAGSDPQVTGRFRRALRGLSNALAEVRDLDVFLEHLREYAAKHADADEAGLDLLRGYLAERREAARTLMLKALDAKRTRRLLRDLARWADEPTERDPDDVAPFLVRHVVRSALWRQYEAVLAYEQVMPNPPIPTLHQLRIAGKRLRYTLEFFEDALGDGAKKLLKDLAAAQDHLGWLQDAEVAVGLVDRLLEKHPNHPALAAFRSEREQEKQRLASSFQPVWDKLSGPEFARRLANMLQGV